MTWACAAVGGFLTSRDGQRQQAAAHARERCRQSSNQSTNQLLRAIATKDEVIDIEATPVEGTKALGDGFNWSENMNNAYKNE